LLLRGCNNVRCLLLELADCLVEPTLLGLDV